MLARGVMRGQTSDRIQIESLGSRRQAGGPHVLDHSHAQRCHQRSPSRVARRHRRRRHSKIPSTTPSHDDFTSTAKPFSPTVVFERSGGSTHFWAVQPFRNLFQNCVERQLVTGMLRVRRLFQSWDAKRAIFYKSCGDPSSFEGVGGMPSMHCPIGTAGSGRRPRRQAAAHRSVPLPEVQRPRRRSLPRRDGPPAWRARPSPAAPPRHRPGRRQPWRSNLPPCRKLDPHPHMHQRGSTLVIRRSGNQP